MPTKEDWSEATTIWREAGHKGSQVVETGRVHHVTLSDVWRGHKAWDPRIEAAMLKICGNPELVAEVKAAQNQARRNYLVNELAAVAGGAS